MDYCDFATLKSKILIEEFWVVKFGHSAGERHDIGAGSCGEDRVHHFGAF